MLLSGLTRRQLLALDPSAKFNSRSSQGPPAVQGHRNHKEEIPGYCQKLTTVLSCSRLPVAIEEVWSGGLPRGTEKGGSNEWSCLWLRETRSPFLLAGPVHGPKSLDRDLPFPGTLGGIDISCTDTIILCNDFMACSSCLQPSSGAHAVKL